MVRKQDALRATQAGRGTAVSTTSESITYSGLVTDGLAKQIAEKIRVAIIEGRLKVDERLPTEAELAVRFSVSRPTIREALKRLAAQNLIRSRRGASGGTYVTRPSQAEAAQELANATALLTSMGEFDLVSIAEARQELGIVCCRIASERREEADLLVMREELTKQRDASLSDVEFCASDVRFHHAIAQATQNPVLRLVMAGVIEAFQPAANLVGYRFRERRTFVVQHERLYDAIARRDAGAAAVVVVEQMNYLRSIYRRAQEWRTRREAVAGR
jgi:GntR family transcriptional repressor for pyruvate dehydrogenase complex